MAKYFIYILLLILFSSCSQSTNDTNNYPNDSTISDENGKPKDSLRSYFPAILKNDSGIIKNEMTRISLKYYSNVLFCFQEPILFNYYMGYESYRFLLLRSFSRPLVFSLCRKGDEVWLVTKALDKSPRFYDSCEIKFTPPPPAEDSGVEKEFVYDSISPKYWGASITYNSTKRLTIQEWKEFELLLANISFWKMNPVHKEILVVVDGSDWIMEGHLKNKYWFVERSCPMDDFRKPGEYLISKSGIDDIIY